VRFVLIRYRAAFAALSCYEEKGEKGDVKVCGHALRGRGVIDPFPKLKTVSAHLRRIRALACAEFLVRVVCCWTANKQANTTGQGRGRGGRSRLGERLIVAAALCIKHPVCFAELKRHDAQRAWRWKTAGPRIRVRRTSSGSSPDLVFPGAISCSRSFATFVTQSPLRGMNRITSGYSAALEIARFPFDLVHRSKGRERDDLGVFVAKPVD